MIGYMSNTCRLAISSGKRAYTTLATCVSASDSTKILPIRIDRQQSRKPCSIASPERTIDTPQFPDWYLFRNSDHTENVTEVFSSPSKMNPLTLDRHKWHRLASQPNSLSRVIDLNSLQLLVVSICRHKIWNHFYLCS